MQLLACIDASPLSERVIVEAATLARECGSPLVLLAVDRTEPALISGGISPPGGHRTVPEDAPSRRAALEEMASRLRAQGVDARAEHRLTHDSIEDAILAAIEELGATHVVIGSHGHGKIHDLLVGSVTQSILRGSHVPVLVIPPAE